MFLLWVTSSHVLYAFDRNEDQPGQGSCLWESPPGNGFNFRQCSVGLCSDTIGSRNKNCTARFTRCERHYVLTGGSDRDACVDGKWTSRGHKCVRKWSRAIIIYTYYPDVFLCLVKTSCAVVYSSFDDWLLMYSSRQPEVIRFSSVWSIRASCSFIT